MKRKNPTRPRAAAIRRAMKAGDFTKAQAKIWVEQQVARLRGAKS